MNTTAYCTQDQAPLVRWAAGVTPLTCPPLSSSSPAIIHHLSNNKDKLLYIALHGLPDQPYLYGSEWITALRTDQITQLQIHNTIVYLPSCHTPQSPILQAFLSTNAQAIIAGDNANYAPFIHHLGHHIRVLLSFHVPVTIAIRLARAQLSLQSAHPAALDTLTLRIHRPNQNKE